MDAEIEKYRVAIEHTGRVVSDMLGECPQEPAGAAHSAEVGSLVSGEAMKRPTPVVDHSMGSEANRLGTRSNLGLVKTSDCQIVSLNGVDALAIYGSPTGPDPWPMRDSGVE